MTNVNKMVFVEKAIEQLGNLTQEACSEGYTEIERMLDRWVIVLASVQASEAQSRVDLLKYMRRMASEEAALLDDNDEMEWDDIIEIRVNEERNRAAAN